MNNNGEITNSRRAPLIALFAIVTSWAITLLGVVADSISIFGCIHAEQSSVELGSWIAPYPVLLWLGVFYSWFWVTWFLARWAYLRFVDASRNVQWHTYQARRQAHSQVLRRHAFNALAGTGSFMFPIVILLLSGSMGNISLDTVVGSMLLAGPLIIGVGIVVYIAVSNLLPAVYSDMF